MLQNTLNFDTINETRFSGFGYDMKTRETLERDAFTSFQCFKSIIKHVERPFQKTSQTHLNRSAGFRFPLCD